MKKLYYIFILFCCINTKISAQVNLVLNASFEDTASLCPDNAGQIFRAKHWFRTNGSPDYYNKCYNGVANSFSIPVNSSGYQTIINNCSAYSGIYTAAPGFNNANETYASKLSDSVVKNTKYFVSLKVSLANSVKYASNNMGVYFSTKTPSISFNATPNNYCHINFSQIISDTLNWTRLFSSFTPDSNYKYISIGNFKDSSLTTKMLVNISGVNSSYLLTDDICVSTDSAYTYNYTYNCTITNIDEKSLNEKVTIYPNPFANTFKIESSVLINEIKVYNSIGQILFYKKENITDEIDTANFPIGIYFIQLKINNRLTNYKLIKNQ